MKITKMGLASIQGKLSRAEMKNIMAGSGTECKDECQTSADCPSDRSCGGGECQGGGNAKRCNKVP